ncbi:MAG: hypothetical protein ACOYL6_05035 [Bacteriovoracaceae bacterium]
MNPSVDEVISSLNDGKILQAKDQLHTILFQEIEKEILCEAVPLYLGLFFNEKKIKEAHEILKQFFLHLKKNQSAETLLEVASILKNEHYSFKNHQTLFLEFEAWAYMLLGKVEKGLKAYMSLVRHYDLKKQVDLQEKLLKDLLKQFPREPRLVFYQAKNYIHQGKRNELKAALVATFSLETKTERHAKLTGLAQTVFLEWDEAKYFTEFLDVLLCQKPKVSKEFIRLVNTTINHTDAFYLFHLSLYFNYLGKNEIANEIHQFAVKHFRKDYKSLTRNFPALVAKIEEKRKVNDLLHPIGPYQDDLMEEKLEILKLKLKFSSKYQNEKDMDRLLTIIQSYDPFFVLEESLSHSLVSDKNKKTKNNHFDNEAIFEELIAQISYYSSFKKNDEEKIKELKFELSKIIDFSIEELAQNRLTDYIIMLHSFKFHDLALDMICRFKEKNREIEKDIKLFLEISYLEISVNNELKKHYDNLNLLSAINTSLPLSKDEKICFLYLEAETLMQLKREKEALDIYKRIDHLEPGYRLSRIRIRQVEKS